MSAMMAFGCCCACGGGGEEAPPADPLTTGYWVADTMTMEGTPFTNEEMLSVFGSGDAVLMHSSFKSLGGIGQCAGANAVEHDKKNSLHLITSFYLSSATAVSSAISIICVNVVCLSSAVVASPVRI